MKFDMSQAWNDATAMLGANREVLAVVAGLFFFLPAMVTAMVLPDIQPPMAGDDPEKSLEILMDLYGNYWWIFIISGIVNGIGTIAMLALLSDSTRPTVADAIKIGALGFLPYILASILSAFAIVLVAAILIGLPTMITPVLGVVGGIAAVLVVVYMLVKFSLSGPVVAIEKVLNPVAVLMRSWQLTKGNSLRLFGFYLLLMIVYLVIAGIIAAILGLIVAALGTGAVSQTVQGLISGLLSAAITVLMVSILAAVYRQMAGPSPERISETFE